MKVDRYFADHWLGIATAYAVVATVIAMFVMSTGRQGGLSLRRAALHLGLAVVVGVVAFAMGARHRPRKPGQPRQQ